MKRLVLSTASMMIVSISIYGDSLSESLENANYAGAVRVGYQSHKIGKDTQDEVAIGVKLHMETAPYYGLQFGATLFTTQGNGKPGFEGVPFFDEHNENYATLAEAYLKGTYSNTTFILGRQTLETPFADSDDIGMVPNTFEAFTLINKDMQDTTLFFSQVQKWSGVDSDAPSKFTSLNGNDGMQIIGVTYEGLAKTTLSGWFYNLDGEVKISYFEASYEDETERFNYGGTVQYAFQDYDNGDSSAIFGAAASFGVKSIGLTGTIAYNKTDGIAADNFFGGGPFLTNAEHNTLKEAGPDGNTILYTLEWDASVVGAEGLSFVANIDAHHGDQYYAREYDVGGEYQYNEKLNFSAIYSDIDDRADSFKNLRVFANYTF